MSEDGRKATQFKKGQSGNPKGRPKGLRPKLNEAFLHALYADFEAEGPAAIAVTREKDPAAYVRVVASLLPKEMVIERPLEGLNDDELAAAITELRARLVSAGKLREGSGDASQPESAQDISSLH